MTTIKAKNAEFEESRSRFTTKITINSFDAYYFRINED